MERSNIEILVAGRGPPGSLWAGEGFRLEHRDDPDGLDLGAIRGSCHVLVLLETALLEIDPKALDTVLEGWGDGVVLLCPGGRSARQLAPWVDEGFGLLAAPWHLERRLERLAADLPRGLPSAGIPIDWWLKEGRIPSPSSHEDELAERFCHLLTTAGTWHLGQIARRLSLDRGHLCRRVKQSIGLSPLEVRKQWTEWFYEMGRDLGVQDTVLRQMQGYATRQSIRRIGGGGRTRNALEEDEAIRE